MADELDGAVQALSIDDMKSKHKKELKELEGMNFPVLLIKI